MSRIEFYTISVATSKGDGEQNEDIAGSAESLAWVIDGATDVPGSWAPDSETGAHWIARVTDAFFRSSTTFVGNPIAAAADNVQTQLQRYSLTDMVPPACSCATVELLDRTIRVSLVGDIFVYLIDQDIVIENPTFGVNEAAAVARQGPAVAGRRLSDVDSTDGILRRRQSYIEGLSGSWVLSNNVRVEEGVAVREFPASAESCILLATDGFARLISQYRIYDSWSALAKRALERGLDDLIEELRSYESRNRTDGKNFKSQDDACAILVSTAGVNERHEHS